MKFNTKMTARVSVCVEVTKRLRIIVRVSGDVLSCVCVCACVGLERLRVRLSGDVFSDLSVPCWRMFIFSCMIVGLKLFD